MAKIPWTEELNIHIESIDQQHQQLIHLVNVFYENVVTNSNKDKINILIRSLKSYASFHFQTEEKLMALHKYPEYETHKKEHKAFVEKVLNLDDRYINGKMVLSVEITNFLKEWITNHIKTSDWAYSQYFKDKGIS